MTTEEYFKWLNEEIECYFAIAENKELDIDVRSHAYGKSSALRDARNHFIPIYIEQNRSDAQKQGFDDYCESHRLPYNNECPECAQLINKQ